jgi:hypothetical protein
LETYDRTATIIMSSKQCVRVLHQSTTIEEEPMNKEKYITEKDNEINPKENYDMRYSIKRSRRRESYERTKFELVKYGATNPNESRGDVMKKINPKKILRFYHQNIRGAKVYMSWIKWRDGVKWLSTNNVGIASLVETNTTWTYQNAKDAEQNARQSTESVMLTTCSSMEKKITDYQPGGTACLLINNWTGYNIERITDETGLGRWSGYKLRAKNKSIMIVLSAYRPTRSSDTGDYTSYSQQWRILRERYPQIEPNPRETFMIDLTKLIRKWEDMKYEILIGVDMNETCNTKSSKVFKLLNETSLIPITELENAPATYTRGSNAIDYIIGTPKVKLSVIAQGYQAFFEGGWDSDHRSLYADIDIGTLFDNMEKVEKYSERNLKSTNWIQANKFMNVLSRNKNIENIKNQLEIIFKTDELNSDQRNLIQKIDKEFTSILLKAEKRCCRSTDEHWSDTLHHAKTINRYWKIIVKGKANKINTSKQTRAMLEDLPNNESVWQGDALRPAKNQLKRSGDILKEIRKEAWNHRLEFLLRLQNRYKTLGDREKEKCINKIRRAEVKEKCYRICKNINKPRGAAGGISHIVINNDKGKEIITNKEEMNTYLRERNVKHFAQAQFTPCVRGELGVLLNQNGLSKTMKDALEGKVPTNIGRINQHILKELKQVRKQLPDFIPFEAMVEGFHKWREKTTTSPSGKHLGIYRTLTKTYKGQYEKKDKKNETTESKETTTKLKTTSKEILTIQQLLMNTAIKHCVTLERWETIHNLFIEKQPGNPLLEKLRVIHIYEADWNLLSKYFISHKLHGKACKQKTIRPEQSGGRPGRSAANAATNAKMTTEILCLQKLTGATLFNDAAACFDRIIENISNAVLLREGLNPKIAKLHSQTLTSARYYIKTKYGINNNPNGHMNPDPFLGTGQGAADSMPRWGLLSDLIIRIYTKLAESNIIVSPITKQKILSIIKAYVDDTYSTMIGESIDDIKKKLVKNAKLWEELLFTIGGKLEITKCKFVVYKWDQNSIGTLTLSTEKSIGTIVIEESETKQLLKIEEIKSNEPYKLLGLQTVPNDENREQKKLLENKRDKMMRLLKLLYIPSSEMNTCVNTVIMSTLKYGQSAMTLTSLELKEIQKPITAAVLPKMGYNRHTPRALVYSRKSMGGIGMMSLYTEQGLAQLKYLIGGWRCKNDETETIRALVESYIIASGITKNPFEDMRILTYMKSDWVDSLKTFLKQIKGEVIIKNINYIQKLRVRDEPIMERAMRYYNDATKLMAINNCRTYLQLMTMAEMADIEGTHLLKEMYHGTADTGIMTTTKNYSRSLLIWPKMPRPPEKAWRIWRKFWSIFTYYKSLKLKCQLARWIPNDNNYRIWFNKDGTVNNNFIPTASLQTPRKLLARDLEMEEVVATEEILLTFTSEHDKDLWKYVWAISSNRKCLKMEKHNEEEIKIQSRERCNLLAIYEALRYTVMSYQKYNSIPKPNLITIIVPSIRLRKQMQEMDYRDPTIHSLTHNDADIMNDIREHLKYFKNYTVSEGTKYGIGKEIVSIITKQMAEKISDVNELANTNNYKPTIMLQINNREITSNIQEEVRSMAVRDDYQKYMTTKMKWDDKCFESIDWRAIQYATTSLEGHQQRFLTKFMHGWLPTRGHQGYVNTENFLKTCPCCDEPIETNHHFIQCKWKKDSNDEKLSAELNRIKTKNKVEQLLYKTIVATIKEETIVIPDQYVKIKKEQEQIGWDQMQIGRLTSKWSQAIEKEDGSQSGYKQIGKVIKLLWMHQHTKWNDRCEEATKETPKTLRESNKLTNEKIKILYGEYNNLDSVDRKVLTIPIAKRLSMTLKTKIAWVQRTKKMIRNGIRRNMERKKTKNRNILQYFTVKKPVRENENEDDDGGLAEELNRKRRQAKLVRNTEKTHKENYRPP